MEQLYKDIICILADIVDAKGEYAKGHAKRVGTYSRMIGEELGLSQDNLMILELIAFIHDIGKRGLDTSILSKPGKLTSKELSQIREHTVKGEKILEDHNNLKKLSKIIRHHHEKYDGSGYPDGIKGEEIPLESRIIACADTFDALTSDRPYRKAHKLDEAFKYIERLSGNQLDPKIVKALLKRKEDFKSFAQNFKKGF
jgi:HD-GYP domain-containing protein (c-di-GMP phosphodiesterase class II)